MHNGTPNTNANPRMVFDPNNPRVRQMIEGFESSLEMREVRRRLRAGQMCRTLPGPGPYYLTHEFGVVAPCSTYLIASSNRLAHSHLTVTFRGFHRVPIQSHFRRLRARTEPSSRTGASGGTHSATSPGTEQLASAGWSLVQLPAHVPAQAPAATGSNGPTSAVARGSGSVRTYNQPRPTMSATNGWAERQVVRRHSNQSSESESAATLLAAAQSNGGEHRNHLAIHTMVDSLIPNERISTLHLGLEHEMYLHVMQNSEQAEGTTREADNSDTTMGTSQTQAENVDQVQVGDASQDLSDMSWMHTGSNEHDETSPGVARRLSHPSGRNSLGPLPGFTLAFDESGDGPRSSNNSVLHQSQGMSSPSSSVLPGTRRLPRRWILVTSPLALPPLRSGPRSMELDTSGNLGLSPTGSQTHSDTTSTPDHSGGVLDPNEVSVSRLVDLSWPRDEDNSLNSVDVNLDDLSFPSGSDLLRLSGSMPETLRALSPLLPTEEVRALAFGYGHDQVDELAAAFGSMQPEISEGSNHSSTHSSSSSSPLSSRRTV